MGGFLSVLGPRFRPGAFFSDAPTPADRPDAATPPAFTPPGATGAGGARSVLAVLNSPTTSLASPAPTPATDEGSESLVLVALLLGRALGV